MPISAGDEGELPPPPPYETPTEKPRIGDWADQWANAGPMGWELTDDTSPEAIAATQRAVVAEAVKAVGCDLAALSEATDLPIYTIKRRLAELEGEAK